MPMIEFIKKCSAKPADSGYNLNASSLLITESWTSELDGRSMRDTLLFTRSFCLLFRKHPLQLIFGKIINLRKNGLAVSGVGLLNQEFFNTRSHFLDRIDATEHLRESNRNLIDL